jgi:hypothetical protein
LAAAPRVGELPRKKVARALSAGMQPTDSGWGPRGSSACFRLGRARSRLSKKTDEKVTQLAGRVGAWV